MDALPIKALVPSVKRRYSVSASSSYIAVRKRGHLNGPFLFNISIKCVALNNRSLVALKIYGLLFSAHTSAPMIFARWSPGEKPPPVPFFRHLLLVIQVRSRCNKPLYPFCQCHRCNVLIIAFYSAVFWQRLLQKVRTLDDLLERHSRLLDMTRIHKVDDWT